MDPEPTSPEASAVTRPGSPKYRGSGPSDGRRIPRQAAFLDPCVRRREVRDTAIWIQARQVRHEEGQQSRSYPRGEARVDPSELWFRP